MALPNQVYEYCKRAQLPTDATKAIVYMAERIHQLEKNFKELALITNSLIDAMGAQDSVTSGIIDRVKKLQTRNDSVQSEDVGEEMEHRMSNRNMGEESD